MERTGLSFASVRFGAGFAAALQARFGEVGFMAIALYTSHMTGLTAMLADTLATGALDLALLCLIGIVAFVAGAAACAVLFNWGRRRGLRSRYANVLLVEAVLAMGAYRYQRAPLGGNFGCYITGEANVVRQGIRGGV